MSSAATFKPEPHSGTSATATTGDADVPDDVMSHTGGHRRLLAGGTHAAKSVNSLSYTNGRASAVCWSCARKSNPVEVDRDAEPDLWELADGWSQAPFPSHFVHRNGSVGSLYTCPSCNAGLRHGGPLRPARPQHINVKGSQS